METILQPPQWPLALSNFVTWCLMWDPKHRPTSVQALNHEYFADAVDPLRPKSSASRLLGRKHSDMSFKSAKESIDSPTWSSKPSWFRRSLIARDNAPAVPQHENARPAPVTTNSYQEPPPSHKNRTSQSKRATWATAPSVGAPMPILPSIRPISPLSNAVTAQANSCIANENPGHQTMTASLQEEKAAKKIGRQLSVASNGNHYADIHRQEAERALNGDGGLMSPPNGQKESFFSHLRKRARRFSGRHQGPTSPRAEDIEANAGCGPWSSNRSSMVLDTVPINDSNANADFTELDKALQNVRYSLEMSGPGSLSKHSASVPSSQTPSKRHHSLPQGQPMRSVENQTMTPTGGPISSRTRRALQLSTHPVHRYETPEEEDELLDEVLNSTKKVYHRLEQQPRLNEDNTRAALLQKDMNRQSMRNSDTNLAVTNPYPTPSPSAKRNGVHFGQELTPQSSRPLNIAKARSENETINSQWPTPPYEENEWAASAAASIFAAGSSYR
jgi:meiosis induction protein kinase IME2/SME1